MSISVAFVSNALTPHQIPFSESMHNLIGNNYKFISCEPISDERRAMGWDIQNEYSYEIKAYVSEQALEQAKKILNNSDVVIIGTAPDCFITNRLKNRKLTFKYSERLYKSGLNLCNLPRAMISSYIHHGRYQKYPIYMLCASAFTAADLSIFGNYKNRTFKWGYFPQEKVYNIDDLIESKRSEVLKILWCGRFIDLKHPEYAINIARRLNSENINFQLRMIGTGERLEEIKKLAGSIKLKRPIEFLESMTPDGVRGYMEDSNIFLFTSDFNEGWGAVLNESMNSGCAVVASHAIGSVPFLVNHGWNGLIYVNGDEEDLWNKVRFLANDIKLCETLGRNAYSTINNIWNPLTAAERFLLLSESLLNGNIVEYKEGPCSKAEIIKNDWFIRSR